jgi:hypothetical protein
MPACSLQLDDHRLQLQLERADISNWKDKWAQENAKTDGIKRECMQVSKGVVIRA